MGSANDGTAASSNSVQTRINLSFIIFSFDAGKPRERSPAGILHQWRKAGKKFFTRDWLAEGRMRRSARGLARC
jgi:hypothetical protein